MKMANFGPYSIDIGFSQLVQEYLQAGDLISKRKFGLYPNDLEKSLRQNFSCVGDGVEFRALEKECLVRFRGTDLPVTVKSLFFRGAYVNTSFAIMPGKVKLAYLLELLAAEYGPLNARTSRVLFFGGIDEGAFVHKGLLVFRFGLSRQKFHLTTIETAYAENEASKKNSYFNAVVRSMDRLVSRTQLHEYVGTDSHAAAAVSELERYLPVVEGSEIAE